MNDRGGANRLAYASPCLPSRGAHRSIRSRSRAAGGGRGEHRPGLKVLFITGDAENAAMANGFLAPGMEMVTKPFAVDALAARIRDMIGA